MATGTDLAELLDGEELDRSEPTPLYEQLRQILVRIISRGQLKPGEQMPGERELEEYFQVSRITVRRALSEMVARGYLRREAGRGTFVMRSVIHDSASFRLGTLMDTLKARGENVSSTILTLQWEQPLTNVATALDIPPHTKVLQISRLVMVDFEPAYLAHNWIKLPDGEGVQLDRELLNSMSIWDVLEQFYGISPDSAEQTLQARGANSRDAESLKVPEGTPVMLVELILRDSSNQPFGFVEVVHIGSLYKFHQVLSNVRAPRVSLPQSSDGQQRWVVSPSGASGGTYP